MKEKTEQKVPELPEIPQVQTPQAPTMTIEQVYSQNEGVFRRDLIVCLVEQNKFLEGIMEALAYLVSK